MMPSGSCAKREILTNPHHNLCHILLRPLFSVLKPDKSHALVCFLDKYSALR